MEPVLFYGVPEGCSFGSIVALEWLGRPYRLCRIQMPEVASGDDYRRLNPVGETPTLMTSDGQLVSESLAILNHIAALGIDSGLAFAQGSQEFDRLNQMLAFLNTSYFNAFTPLWHVIEHEVDRSTKDILTAYGRANVQKTHDQLEAMLGGRDWLVGDRRSLADAYFMGIARWADFHQAIDRRDYPGLNRLYERMASDPAVRFAHAIEHDDPTRSSGGFMGHVSLDEVLAVRQAR